MSIGEIFASGFGFFVIVGSIILIIAVIITWIVDSL